jgi:20S proteasome alpha/beta subunit
VAGRPADTPQSAYFLTNKESNMTKDEALQLALDSMKEIIHWYAVRDRNDVFLNFVDQNPEIQKIMKSITAVEESLKEKNHGN